MGAKIIVTGGAGFIGSNLVRALNARGHDDILIVDELGQKTKWKNLLDLRFAEYVDKDVFRQEFLADRVPAPHVVFHLGARSVTTETNADFLVDNNYRYSRQLCEWALQKGARFIYASSASTYGDGSRGYSDADEVTPTLRPLNLYGFSKQMFDLWVLRKGLFSMVVGIKYFNVYGPHEEHKGEQRSVVSKAFRQILQTGQVRLFKSHRPDYADGEQRRDFVYVKDAVDVTLWFWEHPQISGLFNCGSGRARTWNDLVKAVFAAMGRPPRIVYVDMPEEIRAHYQYHTEADLTKLRRAGYGKPFTPLEEGVREYVQEFLLKMG